MMDVDKLMSKSYIEEVNEVDYYSDKTEGAVNEVWEYYVDETGEEVKQELVEYYEDKMGEEVKQELVEYYEDKRGESNGAKE
jgi:hypothetical protein